MVSIEEEENSKSDKSLNEDSVNSSKESLKLQSNLSYSSKGKTDKYDYEESIKSEIKEFIYLNLASEEEKK